MTFKFCKFKYKYISVKLLIAGDLHIREQIENHFDELIFQSAICAGASQAGADSRCKFDICAVRLMKRSEMQNKIY